MDLDPDFQKAKDKMCVNGQNASSSPPAKPVHSTDNQQSSTVFATPASTLEQGRHIRWDQKVDESASKCISTDSKLTKTEPNKVSKSLVHQRN